jgi:gamma-glutamyl hydrolase
MSIIKTLRAQVNIPFICILFILLTCSYCFKPPVIAILANSQPDDSVDIRSSRVNYQYVRWLEQSRAEVVVIQPWYNKKQIREILSKVNGVLWQGGDRKLIIGGQYEKAAKFILDYIMNLYDRKRISLPLWATCQGFELLHVILSNSTDVLTHFSAENIQTPIQINLKNLNSSRMFQDFSTNDIFKIQNLNTTAQFHQFGVGDSQYDKYPILKNILKITSHGTDLNNQTYISTVEGIKYPIYAIQFHPEMVAYTKDDENGVPQSLEAIKISQLFSNFFVQQALLNQNSITYEDMRKYDFLNAFQKSPVFSEDYYFYFFYKNDGGRFGNKTLTIYDINESAEIKKLESGFLRFLA